MWEAVFLTLAAAAGNSIGKVLQKKGTQLLPPFSIKFKVMRAYVMNKTWIFGLLVDIGGSVLMLKALSLAPVSVTQPVSGCGLAITSVFSHFYLKESMNSLDWLGVSFAGLGTVGIGMGGEEQPVGSIAIARFPWLVFIVFSLFVLIDASLRMYKNHHGDQDMVHFDVLEEFIYGLQSGIVFGLATVISKMGFIFTEQGLSKIYVPLCLVISLGCSAIGFVYQTRGLKHGRAIVLATVTAVSSVVSGVLCGMFALGEKLPSDPYARANLFLGWILITVGVVLLVCSKRIIPLLPRWLRRRRSHGGDDHQPLLAKSNPPRAQEPNQRVPTNPLLHLKAGPSKAKP